jgi:hypothetical protein
MAMRVLGVLRERDRWLRARLAVLVLLTISFAVPGAASSDDPQDILVIVNNSVSAKRVSVDAIKDIFLKKRTNWPGGGSAVPVNAGEGTALRKEFRRRVLAMDAREEREYWNDKKIKTGVSGPVEFGNTLKAVFKLRNSVSYVYRSQYKEGVARVLLVLPAG